MIIWGVHFFRETSQWPSKRSYGEALMNALVPTLVVFAALVPVYLLCKLVVGLSTGQYFD